MKLTELPYEELVKRFCGCPSDEQAGEELFARCLPRVREIVQKIVLARRSVCPPGQDLDSFVEDAVSHAIQNVLRGVHTYQFRAPFEHWLVKVVRLAVLEENRRIVGRGQGCLPVHVEVEVADSFSADKVPPTTSSFRSLYWKDAAALVKKRELHELVTDLLTVHALKSKSDADSAFALGLYYSESWKVTTIAEKLCVSERRIWQIFAEDFISLRKLLRERFRVGKLYQISLD